MKKLQYTGISFLLTAICLNAFNPVASERSNDAEILEVSLVPSVQAQEAVGLEINTPETEATEQINVQTQQNSNALDIFSEGMGMPSDEPEAYTVGSQVVQEQEEPVMRDYSEDIAVGPEEIAPTNAAPINVVTFEDEDEELPETGAEIANKGTFTVSAPSAPVIGGDEEDEEEAWDGGDEPQAASCGCGL